MSITPESVQALLNSDDYGDRLRGVNQLRQLEPAIAFNLIQPLVTDQHVRVRYAAVSQLASLGTQDQARSLDLLRDRLLNDSEMDVQAAAADSLGGLHLVEAYDDLERIYQTTTEWLVKFSIVAALGELGEPRAFDLLQNALNDPTELVQAAAVSSLGELADPRAIPLILPYAQNSDWQIRYRVAQALRHFSNHDPVKATLTTLAQDEIDQVAQEAQRSLNTP